MGTEEKNTMIELSVAVVKDGGETFTEKELTEFTDSFLEFLESKDLMCGGGINLV